MLTRNQKTVWSDCHIPLPVVPVVPVVPHLAVLGPRCCDETVFAGLEIVALHLIEESQHLTSSNELLMTNQLSDLSAACVATGQWKATDKATHTNNWRSGHPFHGHTLC